MSNSTYNDIERASRLKLRDRFELQCTTNTLDLKNVDHHIETPLPIWYFRPKWQDIRYCLLCGVYIFIILLGQYTGKYW